jgi:transposase
MTDPTSCRRVHGGYCHRCDVLVGLVGLHVTGVERTEAAESTDVVYGGAAFVERGVVM